MQELVPLGTNWRSGHFGLLYLRMAVYERRPHEIKKSDPRPLCPHWLDPSLVRADTPYILKSSKLLHQKVRTSASGEPPCPKNVRTEQTPLPLTAEYGRILWTTP